MTGDRKQHIARISEGKDSLKMLDVIITRGLPLDRVTTTDVWATDTVRAELPPVLEAKERIEEKLWQMYRINVEHLCARNADGSKRTYEQMFYHIPNRKNRAGGVLPGNNSRIPRSLEPVVSINTQTICKTTEYRGQLPDSYQTQGTTGARSSKFHGGEIKGFPLATGVTWCQNLKIRPSDSKDFLPQYPLGAENSRLTKLKRPF